MLAIPENDIVKIVRLHDGYHSVFGSSSQVPLSVSVPLLFRFMTHWLAALRRFIFPRPLPLALARFRIRVSTLGFAPQSPASLLSLERR